MSVGYVFFNKYASTSETSFALLLYGPLLSHCATIQNHSQHNLMQALNLSLPSPSRDVFPPLL